MESSGITSYPAECCECGNKFGAAKSLAQEFGMNDRGCGSCPKCNTFLNLTFDEKEKKMITMKWDSYLESQKNKRNN